MKIIKKFVGGVYSGFKIGQHKNSNLFSLYYKNYIVKRDFNSVDECFNYLYQDNKIKIDFQQKVISLAVQAYKEIEGSDICLCRDIANLEEHLKSGKKCGNCEKNIAFELKLNEKIYDIK